MFCGIEGKWYNGIGPATCMLAAVGYSFLLCYCFKQVSMPAATVSSNVHFAQNFCML